MIRGKNRTPRDQKSNSLSNIINTNDNELNQEKNDFEYTKKENLINDLKQKGFNELQIDDIFEAFKRNTICSRYSLFGKNKINRIFESHTIDSDCSSKIRKNKIIEENNNNNSKYKNSFVIKTKTQNNNKNKPKFNCAKLYINASTDKSRNNLSCRKNKIDNKYKNNIKIENIKKEMQEPIIKQSIISKTNREYTRKSQKIHNYINKFKLSYRNYINSIEESKNEMLKKYECDDNYNNYNFKIILETKNIRDTTNNVGYLDIKNIKNNQGRLSHYKSRNDKKEEDKNNLSSSINDSNNSFLYKKNKVSNKSELIGYSLKEIKEEKENNLIKEIKVNKNMNLDNNRDYIIEKKYNTKNRRKFHPQRIKDLRINNDMNKEKKNINGKFQEKLFSNINMFNNRERHIPNNIQNNILIIREQTMEVEEKLPKKNISISVIKQTDNNDSLNSKDNFEIKFEKRIKSKSLSKISDKNNNTNTNHNFVNINLCKNKFKKCSTFYENRGLSIKENISKILKLKKAYDEINTNINATNKINSVISNNLNATYQNDENSESKEFDYDNIKNNKKNYINNIIRLNKVNYSNINNINSITNISDKNIPKNISYNYVTKKYPNGTYKGYILNEKREKNGIMIFDNGAKYEGQWKNDKKNGKGIFTSSHYFDCKNFVGMKYEGEFKDDKFDGFGITTYTNGDRYEGEWKNNKQYGKGIVTYFNGEKYDGDWIEGKFDGLGTFFLKNGERFEGRFKDNKYNGYGKYIYLNGDWLEGIFKNDHPSGKCLLHKKDGTIVNVFN